jgi:hypothetical protein
VSVAASTPPAPATGPSTAATPATAATPRDICPLCATPLYAEQEWCLRCGAAARTRLAAAPNWKAPIIAFAVLVALSLGVLAAALVELAGNSSPSATAAVRTVTTVSSASTPTPIPSTPTTTLPGAAVPGVSVPQNRTGTATAPTSTPPGTGTARAKRFRLLGPALEKRLRERGLLPARPGK